MQVCPDPVERFDLAALFQLGEILAHTLEVRSHDWIESSSLQNLRTSLNDVAIGSCLLKLECWQPASHGQFPGFADQSRHLQKLQGNVRQTQDPKL